MQELTKISAEASTQAGDALKVLTTEITSALDLSQTKDRTRLNQAVASTRVIVGEGMRQIPLFSAWGAMKKARAETAFKDVDQVLDASIEALDKALEWHSRQQSDEKLRLKALASRFFIPE